MQVEQADRIKSQKRDAIAMYLDEVANVRSLYLVVDDTREAGKDPTTEEARKVPEAYAGPQQPMYRIKLLTPGEVCDRAREVDDSMLRWRMK
jgi:hypothetical protein